MDGPHATNAIRQNAYNYFWKKNGYKVLFVECICDDEELLERNEKVCGIALFVGICIDVF